jgi:hypothetical protein
MIFYPVYRIDRSRGIFTRVGSLMEPCSPCNARFTPYLSEQAREIFARKAGDVIVLGPRCGRPRKATAGTGEV